MHFTIQKSTGELEAFDVEKLRRSLTRPGAPQEIAESIINYILQNISHFKTTEDIYRYALDQLEEKAPKTATRYNLKKALLQLGPTGFAFEKYVAAIFKEEGYSVKVDQILKGWCVDHEVDVLCVKNRYNFFIECKFHNKQFYRTEVQVALYMQARFEDILQVWDPEKEGAILEKPWIVINTKFTYEALKYGNCKGLQLLAWNYPKGSSLPEIIDRLHFHPITAIPSLSYKQKQLLIHEGIILCRDVKGKEELLKKLGFNQKQIDRIIAETMS